MKICSLKLLCFTCIVQCYCQTSDKYYGQILVEITKEKKTKKIYAKVEIKLTFPGGDSSWIRSVEKEIENSIQKCKEIKKGKYFVTVNFIVMGDTCFSNIICSKDSDFKLCREVVKVLKLRKYQSKWKPCSFQVRPILQSKTTHINNYDR